MIGCGVWCFVVDDYRPPNKLKIVDQKETKKNNSMEMEVILNGLSDPIKWKVGHCNLAKELWDKLYDLYFAERMSDDNYIKYPRMLLTNLKEKQRLL